jgi:hypothetical protein
MAALSTRCAFRWCSFSELDCTPCSASVTLLLALLLLLELLALQVGHIKVGLWMAAAVGGLFCSCLQSWILSIADALSARSPPSFITFVSVAVSSAAAALGPWCCCCASRSLRRPRSLFFSFVFQ